MGFYDGPKVDYYSGISVILPGDKSNNFFAKSLSPAIDVVDVNRFSVVCRWFDNDPYWGTTMHQHGVAVAVVYMPGVSGFDRGLAEDTPENLRAVFGLMTEEAARNVQQHLPGLEELRRKQWAEDKYHRALWDIEHTAEWDTRPVIQPTKPEPSVAEVAIKYPAAAAYLTAERYAGTSKAKAPAGIRAMNRLMNGDDIQQVLAAMEHELMRSVPESKDFPGRFLKYGPTDLSGRSVLRSQQLAPALEVTIHESDPYDLDLLKGFHEDLIGKRPLPGPYYLAAFHRDGKAVLVEHVIGEYEPWLLRTANDAAFVAHVVQI
jgi:hypothetical protein